MAESFLSSLKDMPSWNEYKTFALKTQADNNAWSAQQAQKQMDFQAQMSNTAHQREVADLKAAGLNPVLSAGGSVLLLRLVLLVSLIILFCSLSLPI